MVGRGRYIKELDPLHVIAGAVQCSSLWMFSDVPAWPPAAPTAAAAASTRAGSCVPPTGTQPPLQLSLDLILIENYVTPATTDSETNQPTNPLMMLTRM